jgi:uncharacterized membrane protein
MWVASCRLTIGHPRVGRAAAPGGRSILSTVDPAVATSAFLASAIEVLEMVAIVVAVGTARSWRATLLGAAGGLLVLAVMVGALGPALGQVSLQPLRLVVGALLLVFGLGWLRKGVLRVSRDGWMAGMGDEYVEEAAPAAGRFDWIAFVVAFKGVSLEGLEVAVIVVAFGSAAGELPSAAAGAAGAVFAVGLMGALTYRLVARIPRRALQLVVGAMLTTFGTFWAAEGAGATWPGDTWALAWLAGLYLAASLGAVRLVARWRAQAAQPAPAALEPLLEESR